MKHRPLIALLLLAAVSCGNSPREAAEDSTPMYSNPIYPHGSSPRLTRHGGSFYYTQTMNDHVSLWKADRISALAEAREHVVYDPEDLYYISAPQLHRIGGAWYLYFSADDGKGSDIRHIYIMENPAEDPSEGVFTMKGWLHTGNRKDIHPTTFEHRGTRYMLWAGTPAEKSGKATVWSIYIAPMQNPWTLSGAPVVISSPEYEWEAQWIDEDGTSMSVPSLVNEGPEFIYSRDSSRLLVYYAASETFTSYYCEGLLVAPASADPLNPASWHKEPEPVFRGSEKTGVLGAGHISFFQDSRNLYILYNGKSRFPDMHTVDNRSPRMQPVRWGTDGIPELGFPVAEDSLLPEPVPVPPGQN